MLWHELDMVFIALCPTAWCGFLSTEQMLTSSQHITMLHFWVNDHVFQLPSNAITSRTETDDALLVYN